MNRSYADLYQSIIEQLKDNRRPKVVLSPELLRELKSDWEKALAELLEAPGQIKEASSKTTIKTVLCILDNAQTTTSELNVLFIKTLSTIKDHELLIYCLSASQKQLIADSFKTGKMLPFEYFEVLKKLMGDQHPEVKEWTLRTIETLGPLSLRLKNEVLAAKPGFSKIFNRHLQSCSQIIELLESEWKKIKL